MEHGPGSYGPRRRLAGGILAGAPQPASPIWSRRLTEWCLVALVLLGLISIFEREIRSLQGQSEKVLVWSSIMSMRTALVIQQLTRQVRPEDRRSPAEKNPLRLLEQIPPNYAGEVLMRDVYSVTAGNWVFDPECRCVGYRLLYPEWLEPRQETNTIWFRVGDTDGDSRLSPVADYRWFGQQLK